MKTVSPTETTPARAKGRPFILDPLFQRVTVLPGVGPRNAKLFEKLCGGERVIDVLWHRPIDVVDRRFAPTIKDAPAGRVATLTVTVHKHFPAATKTQPHKVWCTDVTGAINLIFFHARQEFIEKQLPVGATVIVSGRVEYYNGQPQMPHPDAIGALEERAAIETIEPVYPLTAGLTNKTVRKAVAGALALLPDLQEWQDAEWLRRQGWPAWREAVKTLHQPEDAASLSPHNPARARLAYDELLANQLALALVRARSRKQAGRSFSGDGVLRERLKAALPFELTGAQKRSVAEIDADMKAPLRMLRLLQGDVGSGKTVVAALAMLNAVECGAQAALMAPTEILARQHAASLAPWLKAAGVNVVTLTGRDKGKAREGLLAQIADGTAQIVIGTHALFQDEIVFHDLALAVIDEQHRFGVEQRLRLSNKGRGVDILVMTATPIPRTLALTAYGDMDISRLDEKPPGRQPIDTRLIAQDRIEVMIDGLARQIAEGARVYWVCPLVEESEFLDLQAAQARYEILQARFGARVDLIHGRLKPEEKDEVMRRFANGEVDILVATTVIEVGVNVPEATIMVVEHAERFGLAQLHQLRGRVGRGRAQSYCFLVYAAPLGETARERLAIMRETEDGFVIAEKDLSLRGSGDALGLAQSGEARFRLADLAVDGELLAAAHDNSRLILEKDAKLTSARGQALRNLLYLMERDQAVQYLQSG